MRIKMTRVVVDAEDAGRARRRRETRAMARLTLKRAMADAREDGRRWTTMDGRATDARGRGRTI